ncbi:hypothetical protein ACIBHX_46540 [Nonomuraea sp. NPDC050536]|uniref:hypothetical protein n=1 Tax=Nonomuraea sp. NPDC050536 TaxID=3364366 RepID=UPI0037C75F03
MMPTPTADPSGLELSAMVPPAESNPLFAVWYEAGIRGVAACLITPTPRIAVQDWLYAKVADVPEEALRARDLTDEQQIRLAQALAEHAETPLSISEPHAWTSARLAELGVRLAVVDGEPLTAGELEALASADIQVIA